MTHCLYLRLTSAGQERGLRYQKLINIKNLIVSHFLFPILSFNFECFLRRIFCDAVNGGRRRAGGRGKVEKVGKAKLLLKTLSSFILIQLQLS